MVQSKRAKVWLGLVLCVGAMCRQRLGVWCGVGAVPSKQARQGFSAWCYARIRCKVKVLGAKVWCCVLVLCVGAKQTSKSLVLGGCCVSIYIKQTLGMVEGEFLRLSFNFS